MLMGKINRGKWMSRAERQCPRENHLQHCVLKVFPKLSALPWDISLFSRLDWELLGIIVPPLKVEMDFTKLLNSPG